MLLAIAAAKCFIWFESEVESEVSSSYVKFQQFKDVTASKQQYAVEQASNRLPLSSNSFLKDDSLIFRGNKWAMCCLWLYVMARRYLIRSFLEELISDMLRFFEFYSLSKYKDFHFYKMSPTLISKTPSVDPCLFGMICFSCKIGVYAFLRIFRNC